MVEVGKRSFFITAGRLPHDYYVGDIDSDQIYVIENSHRRKINDISIHHDGSFFRFCFKGSNSSIDE